MQHPLIKLFLIAGLASSSSFVVAGAATSETPPSARQAASPSASAAKIRLIGEVTAIDMATRTLMLRRDNGNIVTVLASSRIKNVGQIKAGDFVIAEYYRAKAIAIKKNTAPRVYAEAEEDPEQPVAKPVTGKRGVFSIRADIIAIDDRKGYATLKGLHGNIVDAQFKNRKTLAAVKIGDQVELQYSDSVAVSIKKVETKR